MDRETEIRGFLSSRRARLSPQDAGVISTVGKRRVPGLRREEVAYLAGVSVEYYTRLERGRATGVSREVLDAVARALHLDGAEREHLLDLFDTPVPRAAASRPARARLRHTAQAVLDSMSGPAIVQNDRLDIVGANALGRALYSSLFERADAVPNVARFAFLDDRAREFYLEWDRVSRNLVALLHTAAGRNPRDAHLVQLVGELSTRNSEFSALWAQHDVLRYRVGPKRYRHPAVGDLEFIGESFDLSRDPGLTMIAYVVEPESPTAEAISLLASWTAPPLDRAAPRSETTPVRSGGPSNGE